MKSLLNTISRAMIALMAISSASSVSWAVELDDATRTVQLNSTKSITLTPEQVKKGKGQ